MVNEAGDCKKRDYGLLVMHDECHLKELDSIPGSAPLFLQDARQVTSNFFPKSVPHF